MKIDQLTPEPEILKEFAKRLARIRKAQGYSQARLAQEAGIGIATLKRIEGGRDSQLDTWLKLLKALGMAPAIDALLPENFKSPMAEVIAISSNKKKKMSSPSGVVWGDETG